MIPRTVANPELVLSGVTEGMLDVHPVMCAVVVTYQVVSDYGDPMDMKECRKVIKIDNLNKESDVQALARTVITKSEVIHQNRCQEVEHVLAYLQNRTTAKNEYLEESSRTLQEQIQDLQGPTETAHMHHLETYLENLYDNLQSKIKGTGLILQLARIPEHLPNLIENESLFPALARVLREEWKKSIELTTNIVYIFFCFATFSVFHNMLAQLKIGFTCMLVLDYEISRHNALQQDLMQRRRKCRENPDASLSKKEYELGRKKYQMLLKKQETLLRVTLYLLLNLSEDTRVEMKMRNKGLVIQLCLLLDRSNEDLLILVISFLKKLSIYVENKEDMAKSGIIRRLEQLLTSSNEVLVNVTLRLLLNLSFDPVLRQNVVKEGLLPKLTSLLENKSHRGVVLCILYHVSMDRKSRATFAYTNCIAELMKLILECPDDLVEPEVVALAINLAASARNAQIISDGPGLKLLMRRALMTRDSLLFKMIRNLSKCSGVGGKKLFLPFLSQLCEVMMECDSEGEAGAEVCAEVMGILGNLTLPDVDFHKVITELKLLPFILHKLQDRSLSNEVLLEVIVFCGTAALDEKCAKLLVQVDMQNQLLTLIRAKIPDNELTLQFIYFLYQILLHASTREVVMENPLVSDYLMELMHSTNKEISQLCSKALDLASESQEEMAEKIRCERFRWHNYQWLDMMMGKTLLAEESDEDYLSSNFIHAGAGIFDLQANLDQMHEGYRRRGISPQGYTKMGYSPRLDMELNYSSNMDILGQRSKSSLMPSAGPVPSAHYQSSLEDVVGTYAPPTQTKDSPAHSAFDMDYGNLDFSPTFVSPRLSSSSMHSMGGEVEGGSTTWAGIDVPIRQGEQHLKPYSYIPTPIHQPRPPSATGSQPRPPSAISSQPRPPSATGSQPRPPSAISSQPRPPLARSSRHQPRPLLVMSSHHQPSIPPSDQPWPPSNQPRPPSDQPRPSSAMSSLRQPRSHSAATSQHQPRFPSPASLLHRPPLHPTKPTQLLFSTPTGGGEKLTRSPTSPSSSFHTLSPTSSPLPSLPSSSPKHSQE